MTLRCAGRARSCSRQPNATTESVLSTVRTNDTIEMVMALVIDRQPILLGNVKAKSGERAEFTIEGGYRLTVQPTLRAPTEEEARKIERIRQIHQRAQERMAGSQAPTLMQRPSAGGPTTTPIPQSAPAPRQERGGLVPIWQEPQAPQHTFSPATSLAGATITCRDWNGRHSMDPKVDWKNVGDLTLVATFDAQAQMTVRFPNAAFPVGVYPASVADAARGMLLKSGEQVVYQSMSTDVVDTLTLSETASETPRAVWQRFRTDEEKPRAITVQGRCTRS